MAESKRLGDRVATTVLLLLLALGWSTLVLWADVCIVKGGFKQLSALGYATVMGTITSSEVKTTPYSARYGNGIRYEAVIKFAYKVGDRLYEGNRYKYGSTEGTELPVHRIVESYPVGKQVKVHYAPRDPADSVLQIGLEKGDLFMSMAMLPFNLIMLGLWASVLNSAGCRPWNDTADSVKIVENSNRVRARPGILMPLYAGAIVSGLMALVLLIIVAFAFSADPPFLVVLAAWGLILGAGVIAYLRVGRQG